jgi:hypothetical protein
VQDRVQPGAVGHSRVDERDGRVEAPPGRRREPHREPADGLVVPKHHPGAFEAPAPIHPHLVGGVDKDVGHVGVGEQHAQRAGAELLRTRRRYGVRGAPCRRQARVGGRFGTTQRFAASHRVDD